jgi:hypothetical protein
MQVEHFRGVRNGHPIGSLRQFDSIRQFGSQAQPFGQSVDGGTRRLVAAVSVSVAGKNYRRVAEQVGHLPDVRALLKPGPSRAVPLGSTKPALGEHEIEEGVIYTCRKAIKKNLDLLNPTTTPGE